MIARCLAGLGAAGAVVAVSILGPGQFGYPYLGMLGGITAFFRAVAPDASVLMFLVPLLSIVVMIAYVVWSLFTIVILSIRAFQNTPNSVVTRAEVWGPLVLSVLMIAGLILLRMFPGQQELPVEFQDGTFVYPTILALLAICLKKAKEPN
jgi:hypothetical protein